MDLIDNNGQAFDSDRQKFWDERYGTEGQVFGTTANQFVVEALADLEPGTVLDLAAGQGRNAVWLAARGHRVTAVDLSPVAVTQSAELAQKAGVEMTTICADLAEWEPTPESFDIVLASYLQVETPLRTKIHHRAMEALAPGGTVFVVAHHSANLVEGTGGPQAAELLFDEHDLEADFAGLDVVRSERILREVEGQSRPAIDVVYLATKPL